MLRLLPRARKRKKITITCSMQYGWTLNADCPNPISTARNIPKGNFSAQDTVGTDGTMSRRSQLVSGNSIQGSYLVNNFFRMIATYLKDRGDKLKKNATDSDQSPVP
jgi:hypothetical protein